jgi:hypothetical protein
MLVEHYNTDFRKHYWKMFTLRFPIASAPRDEEQARREEANFGKTSLEIADSLEFLVNASTKTRTADRGKVAVERLNTLLNALEYVNREKYPQGRGYDTEWMADVTWLFLLARSLGQYLDVHL